MAKVIMIQGTMSGAGKSLFGSGTMQDNETGWIQSSSF